MKHATTLALLVALSPVTAGAGELPFLTPTVEYSGTRVMDTAQGRMEQKLYWTPEKVRTETDFQGMKVTNIVRQDLGVMWMANPSMPTCLEQSLDEIDDDPGLGHSDAVNAENVEYTELGEETIDGIQTTHYEVISRDDGKIHRAQFWVTADNIPLKMVVEPSADDVAVTMTLEDLQLGPIDPDLFNSPGQCMRLPAMPGMPGMPPTGPGQP